MSGTLGEEGGGICGGVGRKGGKGGIGEHTSINIVPMSPRKSSYYVYYYHILIIH